MDIESEFVWALFIGLVFVIVFGTVTIIAQSVLKKTDTYDFLEFKQKLAISGISVSIATVLLIALGCEMSLAIIAGLTFFGFGFAWAVTGP